MLGQSDGQPLWNQYVTYLKNIFTGNWGISVAYFPTPVLEVIKNALPWTIGLVGITTILSFILQQIMGIAAGWKHGRSSTASLSRYPQYSSLSLTSGLH